ncbi:MAG: hypothetical protein ABSA13_00685 [Beijerinckiaceae bacterium]
MLLNAVLTHLTAILLLPEVATRDAYHRLADAYGGGPGMILLPPAKPGDHVVPFRDPAVVQGVCFFDLAKAPVRIKANIEEGRMLSLSFRTRTGKIFYSMTDRGALDRKIDVRLVSEAQLAELEARDDENKAPAPELRLQAPSATGLVVATALIARPGEQDGAEVRIKAVTCRPDP